MYKTFLPLIISSDMTLCNAAESIGLVIGCATSPGGIRNYGDKIKRHYNGVVAETHQNMIYQQPEYGVWDYNHGDFINGWRGDMDMRGHVLAWHWQPFIPAWFTGANAEAVWRDRVIKNITRYPFRVWCVVNEVYDERGAFIPSVWDAIQPYPHRMLEIAAEHIPSWIGAEFNTSMWYPSADSDNEIKLVQDLAKNGLITHYGLQLHDTLRTDTSLNRLLVHLENLLNMCGDIGIKAEITEWDIRLGVDILGNATQADLERQGYQYGKCMELFVKYYNLGVIDAVYFWGSHDGASWIPAFFHGMGAALPLGKNWERKPAYVALLEAMA